ncbi:alkaline phosphatase D family protein [Priestia endophytica]|uniref:alkaline phosphatase D family protein n=2 Tax=Priestia endophytica TaxID=135735 RepID=UPI000DCA5194|nr:alkaline phosphatase [Priestia endophytica]
MRGHPNLERRTFVDKQKLEGMIQEFSEETIKQKKVDRRAFIEGAGKIAGLSLGFVIAQSIGGLDVQAKAKTIKFSSYPFTLGVCSGDPSPQGIVLWTRLAPDPLNGGGMPNEVVKVEWELAKDENFQHIVKKGSATASPNLAHSVHVEVEGLRSNAIYYYRFKSGNELSPVGKTKTLPKKNEEVQKLTFAFASCQQYEHGYYTAYKHLAEEELDVVFHLGDYIYEYGPNEYVSASGNVRTHSGPEIITLADYRNRYAQYRSDANLKAAHAAFPWIVTWDDHEVENNYANNIPEKGQSVQDFIKRRAAAYQAYYEHMPLRKTSLPNGGDMSLYRDFSYGQLASFNVLDSRQYRDDQANGDGSKPHSEESLNPNRTMLGKQQENWLYKNLNKSKAHWNILAQQVFFAQRNFGANGAQLYSMDSWDGYPEARNRIIDFVKKKGMDNLVVLTGDVHASWASNINTDFNDASSSLVGVEFVGTSITSGGNGADKRADTDRILAQNPHIKFFNDYRGYVRCTVTPESFQADYRVLPFVTEPNADISTRASFVYHKDQTGLKQIVTNAVPYGLKKSTEVEEDRTIAHSKAHTKQVNKLKKKVEN